MGANSGKKISAYWSRKRPRSCVIWSGLNSSYYKNMSFMKFIILPSGVNLYFWFLLIFYIFDKFKQLLLTSFKFFHHKLSSMRKLLNILWQWMEVYCRWIRLPRLQFLWCRNLPLLPVSDWTQRPPISSNRIKVQRRNSKLSCYQLEASWIHRVFWRSSCFGIPNRIVRNNNYQFTYSNKTIL